MLATGLPYFGLQLVELLSFSMQACVINKIESHCKAPLFYQVLYIYLVFKKFIEQVNRPKFHLCLFSRISPGYLLRQSG